MTDSTLEFPNMPNLRTKEGLLEGARQLKSDHPGAIAQRKAFEAIRQRYTEALRKEEGPPAPLLMALELMALGYRPNTVEAVFGLAQPSIRRAIGPFVTETAMDFPGAAAAVGALTWEQVVDFEAARELEELAEEAAKAPAQP